MRDWLARGFVLDGAMGTQLIERGLKPGEPSALWVSGPRAADVEAVHRAYFEAGSQALTSNTFGANEAMLGRHGDAGRLGELNAAAVAVARAACGGEVPILGDIGPCGEFLEPYGDLEVAALQAMVRAQGAALARAGVAGFLVETMSDPAEVAATVEALTGFGLPVLASFTFDKGPAGYQTMMGASPAAAVRAAVDAGAEAVGANCGTQLSLEDYLAIADLLLAEAGEVPVLLQPNAGAPVETQAGWSYGVGPEVFAAWALEGRRRGVKVLGGCCGTTPAHIRAAAGALG